MSFKLITLQRKSGSLVDFASSKYWNDESVEKKKVFNAIDLGFDKIERSIKYSALLDSIIKVINKHEIRTQDSNILSLMSGSCWVESQIFKNNDFKSLTNVSSSPKIGHSISRKWHDPLHTGECHEKKQAQ